MNSLVQNYSYLIVLLITTLILGFVVLLSNKKSKINQVFFITQISASIWVMANYLEDTAQLSKYTEFFTKLDYFSALFAILTFFYFSIIFPTQKFYSKLLLISVYVVGIVFALLSFSNLIIEKVIFENGAKITEGNFVFFYYLITVIILSWTCYNIYSSYKKINDKIRKKQAVYVLVGIILLAFFVIIANLLLPKLFIDYPRISRIGLIGVFLFTLFNAYSILKHHLFETRVIETESLVFLIAGALLFDTLTSTKLSLGLIRGGLFLLATYGGFFLIKSVIREIEQRKQLEILAAKLDEANKHLEELDETKDNFLSMAAHELNTPIAAIEGYLSMIIDEKMAGEINEKLMGYLKNIYGSSKRLANLVKNLLNVSRIESNRIHLLYSEVQTEDIIDQAIAEVKIKADEVGHKLTFEKPKPALPKTWFDVDRITEVVINMIGNAIKYTDPPGVITVSAHTDGDKIVVAIKDNGRGIPEEKDGHIFEKFSQVNVMKDQVKGTGLGMFIVKNLIELHKGKVWYKSSVDEKDHSTTFYFSVPILKEKPEDPHEGEGALFQTGQKPETPGSNPKSENRNPKQIPSPQISNGKGDDNETIKQISPDTQKATDEKAHEQKAAEKLVEVKKDLDDKEHGTKIKPEDKPEKENKETIDEK